MCWGGGGLLIKIILCFDFGIFIQPRVLDLEKLGDYLDFFQ